MFASLLCAQQSATKPVESVLERRYKAAQNFQAAHDLDQAAQQYHIFIADALSQIAIGQAGAGEFEEAAEEFEEALRLVPDFPALQLEYAHAALRSGKLDRARLLATGVLRTHPNDATLAAKAHALLGRVYLKMDKDTQAKQEFEQAVALDPTFENGWELAIAELDLGDGDAAAKIFAEMQTSFGDTAAMHMLFGQAYGGSDFQDKAVAEFQKAIAEDDRLPGAHYSLASAYLATVGDAKLPEVEAELRKEIAISPKNAAAYAALGHLLSNQHETTKSDGEALQDLLHATELDPKNPDAFLYLAQYYANAKRSEQAEAALRTSITLTTDPARNRYQVQKAHYLLGRTLLQAGQTEEGKKEIALSQELMQQSLSRDRSRLSDYLQENQTVSIDGLLPAVPPPLQRTKNAEAVHLSEALKKQLSPAIADSYNNLGAIAGSRNDYRAALEDFKRAAEWNSMLPGLDVNLGRAAFAAGDTHEAVGPLRRYLRAHPEDEGARTVLGLSEFLAKDYQAARATLDPLANKATEPLQVQFAYAKSLIETNDVQDGIARLEALEQADAKISEVHRALGEAYGLGRPAKAAAELETAIRLDARDAEAYGALGRLQCAQGDRNAAVANLESAAKLEPTNKGLREDLERCRQELPR